MRLTRPQTQALALVAALAASCGGAARHETFTPVARDRGDPVPSPGASYALPAGVPGAEVHVWSLGAYEGTVDGRRRTIVHVGLTVVNPSDAPLAASVRDVRLESIRTDDGIIATLRPVAVRAARAVPAEGDATTEVFFAVPPGLSPDELDGFQVRWSVAAGGHELRRLTAFRDRVPASGYPPGRDPAFGYFDAETAWPYAWHRHTFHWHQHELAVPPAGARSVIDVPSRSVRRTDRHFVTVPSGRRLE